MIRASFEKQNGSFTKIEVTGHSGLAEAGADIVCSAVSSVLWCTTNTLETVLGVPLDITERDGYVSCNIPPLAPDVKDKADVLLKGMLLFFTELQKQYGDFIQVMEV